MKMATLRSIGFAGTALGLIACGGSGGSDAPGSTGSGSTGLAVLESTPAMGATNVSLGTSVSVRFNMPIEAATVTSSTFSVWSTVALPGGTQVTDDTVTFVPSVALDAFAPHTIRLGQGIRSTAGDQLPTATTIEFLTTDGSWSGAMTLPTDATLTGLAGTVAGETVALRTRSANPFSDLVVSHRLPGASWESEQELFGDGSVAFAGLALDDDGWGVAVARRFVGGTTYSTWARERDSNGQWAVAVEMAQLDTGFGEPRVAIAGPGSVVVAWRRNTTEEVWATNLDAGGAWAVPIRLSVEGADADSVAIGADGLGNAIVVWREDSQRLQAARYSVGGGWGNAELVHANFACCVSAPAVAVASDGDSLVGFESSGSVFVARYDADNSVWAAGQAVSGVGCGGALARSRVGLNDQGQALATWHCDEFLWSARRDASGVWEAPIQLGDTSVAKDSVLSVDRNGIATVLWSREPSPGAPKNVVARRAAAGQAWSAQTVISSPSRCGVAPRLVTLPGGSLRAAWTFTINCDFTQGRGAEGADFD